MNVENATSDDSVVIDDDLVAALGFEPAADIIVIDDAKNDSLSISSDDIQVTTDSKADDATGGSPLGSGPPSHKNNRSKSKNRSKAKIHKAKPIKLEDKLAAESKAETEAKAAPAPASDTMPEAKKAEYGTKADTDTQDAAARADSSKPRNDKKQPTAVDDTETKPPKPANRLDGARKAATRAEVKMPPPPIAANAVLLSEPAPADYSFADLTMPDIKGALARFTRRDGAIGESTPDAALGTTEVSANSSTETVIDARVSDAPAIVTSAPATSPPVSSPPVVVPTVTPQPQIVEVPLEPNVYMAPKRSGRTRIRSRKVRRQIRHIDPWSVLTFSVIFHACVFGALLLSSILVWRFADGAGLIERTESFWAELADKPDFAIDEDVLIRAAAMIAGLLAIASSVLLVLLTVFFNLISDLVGGIRVTVIEEEPIRSIK